MTIQISFLHLVDKLTIQFYSLRGVTMSVVCDLWSKSFLILKLNYECRYSYQKAEEYEVDICFASFGGSILSSSSSLE